ncbi:flagellar brake protein [Deefgea rivuli]|uniref:flagellar brake protein n=1 Tax=Deefgea rivuli TaxID=400948 RepID=UPI000482350F|nr:flagellar brake protein [Deefgea rivuli]
MSGKQSLTPIYLKDPSPYLVSNADEIEYTLNRLAKKPELACLYADQQRHLFVLSALLAVNPETILFDYGPDQDLNRRLLSANSICCVAHLSSVHYQFDFNAISTIIFNNKPAFQCPRPQQILRLQRRDFYRLSVPLSTPLSCLIPLNNGDAEISISDISLGGMGLLGYFPDISLDVGSILKNCRIELPLIGVITADVEVCTSSEQLLKNGIRTLRSGCRFINLSGSGQTLLQRYINQVDRKRLALE